MIAYISVEMSPKEWSKNTFGWARAEVTFWVASVYPLSINIQYIYAKYTVYIQYMHCSMGKGRGEADKVNPQLVPISVA